MQVKSRRQVHKYYAVKCPTAITVQACAYLRTFNEIFILCEYPLTWVYGVPGDSHICIRWSHSSNMQLVGEIFGMFFFHSVQLNLAGGDGMTRLVAVNTPPQQLKREECECVNC